MERTAIIDGSYRYLLRRVWDAEYPQITFIMLNPSTADAEKDDPTIRKCIKFANSWGYGSLEVVNLFAYRATKPRDLFQVSEPIGSDNNLYLLAAAERAKLIILAWGIHGSFLKRDRAVLNLFSSRQCLYCLGRTKAGHPRHPLWLNSSTQPTIF
ncbi:DUF1643 domain-containing protein [Nostoc sp. 106C]|uniref:DUF1643 domain-containing protein n=1 Tax=Nostoc sp. 106C TaxID=1932667 RepID=UPI000A371E57|nr:DUF1643 domain-containing protein [Nostoc sp. 106C]OUL32370.1 hypothetical protein BV375_09995 [Nostoc sp. 106C]